MFVSYGERFYGGPCSRLFGITPSLQKISLIKYSGKEVYINDHFYYPYSINNKAIFCAYLLNYRLLLRKDSKEYKIYNNDLKYNSTFYKEGISILINEIDFEF